jgi:hypothetical protein
MDVKGFLLWRSWGALKRPASVPAVVRGGRLVDTTGMSHPRLVGARSLQVTPGRPVRSCHLGPGSAGHSLHNRMV